MNAIPQRSPSADFATIKARQRSVWATGDYAVLGTTLQIVGESLCEALDLRAGSQVLDVAAGNGNATLAAARRGGEVTATDYVGDLLQRGKARADANDLTIDFQEADAENLPFPDASFDVVLSTFGVMFTPDQSKAAAELVRVCRPGGKIGLANWTPEGFIGQLFKTIGKYVPQPALPSPLRWGTRDGLEELFGTSVRAIRSERDNFVFRYRSPAQWIEVFRTYYGPVNKAYAALTPDDQSALTHDIMTLIARGNRSGDAGVVLPAEYLQVVIERA